MDAILNGQGVGAGKHGNDASKRKRASAAKSTERRGAVAPGGLVYPAKQLRQPVDLWSDCEAVPFSYRTHAMQYNERMLARSMGWKRNEVERLSRYQQTRRFSGCRSADPADWLFACRPGSGLPVAVWLNALAAIGDGFLKYDSSQGVFFVTPIE